MLPKIKIVAISLLPFLAIFSGMFAFFKFQNYQPEKIFRSQGNVAGTETEKLDLKYENSIIISESYVKGSTSITVQTPDSTEKVLKYYERTLTNIGWNMVGPAIYKRGDETITLTLIKEIDGSTIVNVDHYYSAVPTL